MQLGTRFSLFALGLAVLFFVFVLFGGCVSLFVDFVYIHWITFADPLADSLEFIGRFIGIHWNSLAEVIGIHWQPAEVHWNSLDPMKCGPQVHWNSLDGLQPEG